MKIASGIVIAIVNVPHGLSASALTTTMPRPAMAMTTMKRMAMAPANQATGSDLVARDLGERPAAAPDRGPEDDEVVDGAGQAAPGDEPDEAGGIAELCRQRRTDERPGPGDGGEVVAEEHPLGRGIVVVPVVLRVSWRHPRVVQHHDPRGNERAVVAVGDGENAEGGQNQIQRVHIGSG